MMMNGQIPVRYTKLDGLRGLLSLIVALNHSFLIVAIPSYANVWNQNYLIFAGLQAKLQQLLMIIGNGGVAVTLFFILSGLVLGPTLKKIKYSPRGLTAFYVKRLLRLYPVYVVVIMLIAIYMKLGFEYQSFAGSSSWMSWWMNFDMTFKEFVYNFFFIHTYLGGVTWTLRVIIIASFLFPILYLLNKRTTPFADIVIFILLILASFTIFDIQDFRDLRYLYMFYAGLSLPKFRSFFEKIHPLSATILLVPATILLFTVRYQTNEYTGGMIETFVGFFMIGSIVYSERLKIFDFLDKKTFQFFGKISYSLYLIHFSILYILARAMFTYLPNLPYSVSYLSIHSTLFIISVGITTVISLPIYKFIEIPSVWFSNQASRKIDKK